MGNRLPDNLPRPLINSRGDLIRYTSSNIRYKEILKRGSASYADNHAICEKINKYMGYSVVQVHREHDSNLEWVELIQA